jgi:hypothetical protein
MRRDTRHRRSGFTLAELCAVMFALFITLSLSVVVLGAALQSNRVGAATLRNLRLTADIANAFRADVAAASAVRDRFENWSRGPSCLILKMPSDRFVIYLCVDEKFNRIERGPQGESRLNLTLPSEHDRVEFEYSDGDRPLITLHLIEAQEHGPAKRTAFAAALAGDRR